jgi:hypothetical protein
VHQGEGAFYPLSVAYARKAESGQKATHCWSLTKFNAAGAVQADTSLIFLADPI